MINKRVLVTYGWVRSAWVIVRNLARHGLDVYVGDTDKHFMASLSRYSKGSFSYPQFRSKPDEFIACVIDFIKKYDIGTYIPCHEEILTVAKNIAKFPPDVKIPISNYDTIFKLYNKKESGLLVEKLSIPIPKTLRINDMAELEEKIEYLKFPVIIKMQNSNGAHGVFFAHSKTEVIKTYKEVVTKFCVHPHYPLIQEYVHGRIYAATLLANQGEIIAQFMRRNIREKESFGGTCTKCESIHEPDVADYAKRIAQYMNLTGVAMFEFIVDEQANKKWLMEINPRYWGTVGHDIDCGIEYPYYQYCIANNINFTAPDSYPNGVKSRWIVGDIISFFNRHKLAENKWANIKSYIKLDDDFFLDFKVDDPIPFLWESFFYFRNYLRTKKVIKSEDTMLINFEV
jgi:predicted ATP-grasp superfamily ATP-dependent carboligase